MFCLSPSSGDGSSSRLFSSHPLNFQTIIEPGPRFFRPNVFDEPPYSQMVEISDSLGSESTSASRAEECVTSSKAPVDVAGSSQEREEKEVRVPEGSWSFDKIKSKLTQADLD